MYTESLPKKLKAQREKFGFSQRDVAKETKIPQASIARFEKGDRIPDVEKLAILADFYGVSIDWLLGTSGGKSNPLAPDIQK